MPGVLRGLWRRRVPGVVAHINQNLRSGEDGLSRHPGDGIFKADEWSNPQTRRRGDDGAGGGGGKARPGWRKTLQGGEEFVAGDILTEGHKVAFSINLRGIESLFSKEERGVPKSFGLRLFVDATDKERGRGNGSEVFEVHPRHPIVGVKPSGGGAFRPEPEVGLDQRKELCLFGSGLPKRFEGFAGEEARLGGALCDDGGKLGLRLRVIGANTLQAPEECHQEKRKGHDALG